MRHLSSYGPVIPNIPCHAPRDERIKPIFIRTGKS